MIGGVDLDRLLTDAVERAGGPLCVIPLLRARMAIPLLMLEDQTPERVGALMECLVPGMIDCAIEDLAALSLPITESVH